MVESADVIMPTPASTGAMPHVPARPLWRNLVKLARPTQWSKGAFVLVGPAYHLADPASGPISFAAVVGAFLAFGFASSSCYVVNDIRDREADRLHPRKRRRPLASGQVPVGTAGVWAGVLAALAAASVVMVGLTFEGWAPAGWLGLVVLLYVLNTNAYSLGIKQVVILDVISLAAGFVLRVLGGCAAVAIEPSSWLLNCTFFISMFLAFGKRLGERRTMGGHAAAVRGVQASYTDELLRMTVVVTAVAALLSYAGYVQAQGARFTLGFNLLWLTILPATYGLLRCILLLEHGRFDDPTELASRDRAFQIAMAVFVATTAAAVFLARNGQPHPG